MNIEGLLCLWGGTDRTARRSAEQRSAGERSVFRILLHVGLVTHDV